uniref:DNA polymerase III polC-type n=1 Tax=Lygus hesperus TaxID=30085 RepID=A0A0A9XD04_LYGHE
MKKFVVVFLDFEATGLYQAADIVEIGAVAESGPTFNVYLATTEKFTKSAAEVTGMSVDSNNRLLKNGCPLDTVDRKEGFERFFKFLEGLNNSSGTKKLVLATHGARCFDMPLFKANLKKLDMAMWHRFDKLVFRFCDTLVFARTARNRLGLNSLSLRNIANTLDLSYEDAQHGALSDAQLTKRVAGAMGMNDSNMSHCIFKWATVCFRRDIL